MFSAKIESFENDGDEEDDEEDGLVGDPQKAIKSKRRRARFFINFFIFVIQQLPTTETNVIN